MTAWGSPLSWHCGIAGGAAQQQHAHAQCEAQRQHERQPQVGQVSAQHQPALHCSSQGIR